MYIQNAIQSIFWGVIVAGMSLVFQLIAISLIISFEQSLEVNDVFLSSLFLLIVYSFSEEAFKYFITAKKILPISYGRGSILNAWLAGIGFSLIEAFIIYQKNISEKIDFSLISVLSTAPLHILTFGTLGYFLTISEKNGLNIKILLFNIVIHFFYNYSIIHLDYYNSGIKYALLALLLSINIYGLLTVNKKLASD